MSEQTYIVRFKPPESSVQPVRAARVEVDEECLIFLREDGTLAAFFHLNLVESWRGEEA